MQCLLRRPWRRPYASLPFRTRPHPQTKRCLSTSPPLRDILGLLRNDTDIGMPAPGKRPRTGVFETKSKIYPPASARPACRDPIAALTAQQLTTLDPTGARSRLFSKTNTEAAKVGDILLVRQKSGDPFSGVCLNIRQRGVDTAILLRNQLTRVGVEMWYKVYSPNVEGIEVVQRAAKRARRARLYFMRLPKHDRGSVQNIVAQYLRQRAQLRSGSSAKGRDANAGKKRSR